MSEETRAGLGLVGGLGPGATVHYYERLARAFAGHPPPFVISHADVQWVLARIAEDELDALAEYLVQHIRRLERAGVGVVAIAAVAPHICVPRLKKRLDLPLVDLIDCVRGELEAKAARRVAVLGTRFVMESDLFGRLSDFEVVRPEPAEIELIHANYVKIAVAGQVEESGADIEAIGAIAQRLNRDEGAERIILAGTELSLAFDELDCDFPALDCARAHIDAILAASGLPRNSPG